MQIKYDSASLGRLALPALQARPAKPSPVRPARAANALLTGRAELIRGGGWEAAAWFALSASVVTAIGLSFLI
jgi:hypothetical protein